MEVSSLHNDRGVGAPLSIYGRPRVVQLTLPRRYWQTRGARPRIRAILDELQSHCLRHRVAFPGGTKMLFPTVVPKAPSLSLSHSAMKRDRYRAEPRQELQAKRTLSVIYEHDAAINKNWTCILRMLQRRDEELLPEGRISPSPPRKNAEPQLRAEWRQQRSRIALCLRGKAGACSMRARGHGWSKLRSRPLCEIMTRFSA